MFSVINHHQVPPPPNATTTYCHHRHHDRGTTHHHHHQQHQNTTTIKTPSCCPKNSNPKWNKGIPSSYCLHHHPITIKTPLKPISTIKTPTYCPPTTRRQNTFHLHNILKVREKNSKRENEGRWRWENDEKGDRRW